MKKGTTPYQKQFFSHLPDLPKTGRIAIFGGSFNPPHIAHTLAVQTILSLTDVAKVWILPTYSHAFSKDLADFDSRLELCRHNFSSFAAQVEILDLEKDLPKPSYTVQTLKFIKQSYPELRPYLIIGSDIVDELHLWHNINEIREIADFLVIPRKGYAEIGDFDVILPELSSTYIRNCFKSNMEIPRVLNPKVKDIIIEKKLYSYS